MTTGTVGTTTGPNYDYRNWAGGDGKYEVVNGKQRVKFNNYHCLKATLRSGPYYRWYLGGWNISDYPSWTLGSETFGLNDTVRLQSKLADKVRNTTLHLGKNVAEGRQFLELCRKTLFAVGSVLRDIKVEKITPNTLDLLIQAHMDKGGRLGYEVAAALRKHRFRAKDVAGMWLELQYGWRPLINDVYKAALIFQGEMENSRTSVIRVATSRTVHYNASASPSIYKLYGLLVLEQKLMYEFAENETISQQRSLGLEDPAGIIWEVVPYSFVVDWFMPIGSYLNALNVLPLLKGRWVLTKVVRAHAGSLEGLKPPNQFRYDDCHLTATYIDITRSHGEGFTFFDIAPPDIKPLSEVFSPMHITNAVAIVTQMISGGPVTRR